LLPNYYPGLFPWRSSGRGMKFHLMPRSKNTWSYTSTPQNVFGA